MHLTLGQSVLGLVINGMSDSNNKQNMLFPLRKFSMYDKNPRRYCLTHKARWIKSNLKPIAIQLVLIPFKVQLLNIYVDTAYCVF